MLFLRLRTNEGVTGVGFITGLGFVAGAEMAIVKNVVDTALRQLIVGEDPLFTELLWDKMFRSCIRFGRKGAVLRAISLVDIALWDLRGQHFSAPVWQLLGGHKTTIPLYGSGGHYQTGEVSTEKLEEEIRELLSLGYRGIKMKVGGQTPREDLRRVAAMREIIDPDVELMVDANEGWSLHEAHQFARAAEDLGLAWLEEPIANDNLAGYRYLSEKTSIPLAAGENEYTRYGFQQLIESGVLVCQPDVTRVGGVSEWMKVAHLASARGLPVVPHGVHELHVQLAAACTSTPMLEYFPHTSPIQAFISECIIGPESLLTPKNGRVEVPTGPGLGLQYDWPTIERHRIA